MVEPGQVLNFRIADNPPKETVAAVCHECNGDFTPTMTSAINMHL